MVKAVSVISIVLLIVCTVYLIWNDYHNKHPHLCENCKHLICKGGDWYRYKCRIRKSFDKRPKCCCYFEPK